MTRMGLSVLAAVGVVLAAGGIALAAGDRYAVKVPDGLSFAEFKGYESWNDVAVSQTETSLKVIAGNPAMMSAYHAGAPAVGKTFPEGSRAVKIEWGSKKSAESPYFVMVPDKLKTVSFMVKDSKRFPKTHGWAFAQFAYDPATDSFKANGTGSECGFACHTAVASKDYVFTAYPKR